MFQKIFFLILILKLTQARDGSAPNFNFGDRVVTLDTDKFSTQNRNPALWQYPWKTQIPVINTPAKNAKPTTIKSNTPNDNFSTEWLNIALQRLVMTNSEMGKFLGANNTKQIWDYLKKFAFNEQKETTMTAYIESSDNTDTTTALSIKNEEYKDKDEFQNINGQVKSQNLQKIPEFPERFSFLEYVNWLNNVFQIYKHDENYDNYNTLDRITENGNKFSNKEIEKNEIKSEITDDGETKYENLRSTILKNNPVPIPYNNPAPNRIQPSTTNSNFISSSSTHLNTPKLLIPHLLELSHATKIPSKEIEKFLASKPKLLELLNVASRFQIGYDHNLPIKAQIYAAVQRAIEKDEDLKRLISFTST